MKKAPVRIITLFLLLVSSLSFATLQGGDYNIVNSTLDGGGGRSAGGDFTLEGTIGQPDAGTLVLTGGTYSLAGGFWTRSGGAQTIFKDGFESL